MLLVDDHLALCALNGRTANLWHGRVPTVPWCFHVRIIRAIIQSSVKGRLSRLSEGIALNAALRPHPDLLRVLDPRPYTESISGYHGRRGVSLMAAELLGAATATRSEIHIAEDNFNEAWKSHLVGTGVCVVLYSRNDIAQAYHE